MQKYGSYEGPELRCQVDQVPPEIDRQKLDDTEQAMTNDASSNAATFAPELVGQFHPTRNADLSLDRLKPGSHVRVWWICAAGHDWEAPIYSRVAGSGCPYCGQRKVGYGNDLATCVPEVAEEWHPTKNLPLTADQVLPRSNRRVWWLGPCGHEWESIIGNRTKATRPGCPYCANQRVGHGNDLVSRFPQIAAEWHPTKNDGLAPDRVTSGARLNAWWLCSNGHEWRAMVFKRTTGSSCEKCKLIGLSELEVGTYTEIRHVLGSHFSNIEHDVSLKLSSGRRLRVDIIVGNFAIEFDGSYWHAGKEARDLEKTTLLAGRGFTVIRVREYPLSPLSPYDVVVRRAPTAVEVASAAMGRLADEGLLTSEAADAVRAYITAGVAGGEDDANEIVSLRKLGDYGARSLAVRFPLIALEWHPTLNHKTPRQVTAASGRKVWWLCPEGHEYAAKIDQRTGKGTGCGFCSGRYPTRGTSLAALRPDLAERLHPTLNGDLTAELLLPHTHKVVWWLCSLGHATQDSVANRAKGMVCQLCPNARRALG